MTGPVLHSYMHTQAPQAQRDIIITTIVFGTPCTHSRYDIERVPTLPAEQELRDIKEFSAKPPIARNNKRRDASCLQSILDVSEESLESEVCISEHQLQMLVDVGLAQSVSQQYSMVLQRELRQSEVRGLQARKFLYVNACERTKSQA